MTVTGVYAAVMAEQSLREFTWFVWQMQACCQVVTVPQTKLLSSHTAYAHNCHFCHYLAKELPSVLWHCWLGIRKSIQPVKIEWWGAGAVIWLVRNAYGPPGATATPSFRASLKSRESGLTFLVPAYPGCARKETIKWVIHILLFHRKAAESTLCLLH